METRVRFFKTFPERGLTIETQVSKISLEGDEYGKEIFLVVKSLEIHNEDEFFTDLNGLHGKKRTMKAAEDYNEFSENLYPATSFVYIQDQNSNIRMT